MLYFRKLKNQSEHCYILESVGKQEYQGRYTFLGYQPKLDVTCTNGVITLKDMAGKVIKKVTDIHPGLFLTELLKDYKSPRISGLPTFTGGLVGYFSGGFVQPFRGRF